MDLPDLIEELSKPAAYPFPTEAVEIRQTHISVVFLAGQCVYKIKKPVNLGFLDFTSLEKRRHFCEEEVRLNRRLAPEVYLGVVPVVRNDGGLRFECDGNVIEWAVKMQRLPDRATLQNHLFRHEVGFDAIRALADRIASFHRQAETNDRIAAFGRFDAVAKQIRDVFARTASMIGTTVQQSVFDRVKTRTEEALARLHAVIEGRATRGAPRDCHGDLHLDHIYLFPDRSPPSDLVIVDCIEFNERLRFIDPVADMAFLAMDLAFHGRRDLAHVFADAYFRVAHDSEGRELLPLYTTYRATVRGMVEGLELVESEVSDSEKAAALARGRAHWLLALGECEPPGRKPCLLLAVGLPGTGKSTLARHLAKSAGLSLIRSDVIRKELAGIPTEENTPPALQPTIYSQDWTERTYAECLRRAEHLLFNGQRVIVDATFREDRHRQLFLDTAAKWAVPSALFVCQANPQTIRQRLEARHGDASDADWSVYQHLAASWEDLGDAAKKVGHLVPTEGGPDQSARVALELLRRLYLAE